MYDVVLVVVGSKNSKEGLAACFAVLDSLHHAPSAHSSVVLLQSTLILVLLQALTAPSSGIGVK